MLSATQRPWRRATVAAVAVLPVAVVGPNISVLHAVGTSSAWSGRRDQAERLAGLLTTSSSRDSALSARRPARGHRRFQSAGVEAARHRASASFGLAAFRVGSAPAEAGGCSIVGSVLAATSQPHGCTFGVLHLKHAVRLRRSSLRLTRRCARQRRSLELHHGADGSGGGPSIILIGPVVVGSSRPLSERGFIGLYLVYLSYAQIWAENRVAMCQCDPMV